MRVGISTASLFKRYSTLNALKLFNEENIDVAEVFLESFCEYNKPFGEELASVKGKTNINSIHTLTTQFEPQLFSENEVAKKDSFELLKGVLDAGKAIGAKNYTFHGAALLKRTPLIINFDSYTKNLQKVIDICLDYGITLAHENVDWCYMNYVGFYSELKKRTQGLRATLDIKQARLSKIDLDELIDEMAGDIVTVHLSDIKNDGKMCLPLTEGGTTDFEKLFSKLKSRGFDGAIIIEAYCGDFIKTEELFDSYKKVQKLAEKIF